MRIKIIREDREPIMAEVETFAAIPAVVFDASQHFGGGTYTATVDGDQDTDGGWMDGERLYRLTAEWLEE